MATSNFYMENCSRYFVLGTAKYYTQEDIDANEMEPEMLGEYDADGTEFNYECERDNILEGLEAKGWESGEGATLAVNEAMAYMSQKVQGGELGLNDILATDIVLTVRQRLFAEAEAKELAVRDFACTFLGLISSPDGTLIMQIGDGGVVVDFGHGLQLPLTPMVGEYANMTHFITDEDAVSRLETFTSTERAHKVAAFTDGIQRLALNMLDNSPHVPFFTPFFNGLASATQEQLDLLPELLKQFLSSPAVNERTDDDKTLALALWLP